MDWMKQKMMQKEEGSKDLSLSMIKKESQLKPSLVFQIEKFEANLTKFCKKTGSDLVSKFKRSVVRDFRIGKSELEGKIALLSEIKKEEGEDGNQDKKEKGKKKRKKNDELSLIHI
eukprot:TRINITY_DN3223_c0_g1_i1.p1 TRINITY_DN3223_c0_g1~~TRINITY_DN3223_c0_g1_i1.p1  ORF type:complete len:116 (-),score=45.80 TRINITY_DN3223_c0_g1_i1:22-369(-)